MRKVRLRIFAFVAVAFTAPLLIGSASAQSGSSPTSGKQGETGSTSSAPKPPAQPSTDLAAGLSVPPGATPEIVAMGFHLYRGETSGGTCYTCHGADAKGTPLAPDLTANKWLWADGSWASITKTVTDGVPRPKKHANPMPPKGGTQFTPEQVSAVAAYVWAVSHP